MPGKNALVIVESPTKAKTIRKFLPKSFSVEASMGHVRDLPQSASDIPAKLKGQEWAKLGVNVSEDFEPLYVIPKNKSAVIKKLKERINDADELYLATDEDREGESISWHLTEILKPKIPVKRMVFHEITKSAIERALQECRKVDLKLVRAQETRRILDRLVGYTVSPLLWKKIAFGLSAGRVQSIGLRFIVERERERSRFKKAGYWGLLSKLQKGNDKFDSKLHSIDGTRIATGKDFSEETGKLNSDKVRILEEKEAKALVEKLKSTDFIVQSVEEKPFNTKPAAPFITSTLQQEANRKLGLSSRDAMRIAQGLYEEGLITYMRTDSPNLSKEALDAARNCVLDLYGKDYLSPEPRQFTSKSRGAQEAHEAIRPAGSTFVHPKDAGLSGKELALYELIWKRTVASQMTEAQKLSVSIRFDADKCLFVSSGSRILFPGFLRAYVEGSDDPDAALEDQEVNLPQLKTGDKLKAASVEAQSHETKPPARYTEASLVQRLEKDGIGRPSTYASIISTIIERGYVKKQGNALVPTFMGMAVSQFLEKHFESLVDAGFTSKMEESLDKIAEGEIDYLPYLKQFFLGKEGLENQVKTREKKIDPDESRAIVLPNLKGIKVRVGRYGAYLVQEGAKSKEDNVHANIPEDVAPADLKEEDIKDLLERSEKGPEPIGVDPKTKKNIYCLIGRYGPYVQLGEVTEEVPKPRRASVPKGVDPKTVTLEKALELLSLPRELGFHPDTKKPILANAGRFGPYVVHDGDFRSLKKDDNVYTVDLKRALEILSEEKISRRGSTVLKDFGKHPSDEKPVQMMSGKYGAYIKHGSMNASVPPEMNLNTLTFEQALSILATKAGKQGKAKA